MTKKIGLWFLVNALLPMMVPALFLAVLAWFNDGSFPFFQKAIQLVNDGFYVFSASALVFSLYEDYGAVKRCIDPMMQTGLVILLLLTLGMFYMTQVNESKYVEGHLMQFYMIWFSTAILAAIAKYKIITFKAKLRYL